MGIKKSAYYYSPKENRFSDMTLSDRIEAIAMEYPLMAPEGSLQSFIVRIFGRSQEGTQAN